MLAGSLGCRHSCKGVPSLLWLHWASLGACIAPHVWLRGCMQAMVIAVLQRRYRGQAPKGLGELPICALCMARLHAAIGVRGLRLRAAAGDGWQGALQARHQP